MQKVVTILKKCGLFMMLLSVCGCVTSHKFSAQQMALLKSWPRDNASSNIDGDPVYVGYVAMVNKDTLSGLVKFGSQYKPQASMHRIMVLPSNKTKKSDIIDTKRKDIKAIRVYQNAGEHDPVDFVRLKGYDGFSILLAGNDKVGIYNVNASGGYRDSHYDGKVILIKDNVQTVVYSYLSYLFHSPRTLFLKFINKRYKQHFKKSDFGNENAMIGFIMTKEL